MHFNQLQSVPPEIINLVNLDQLDLRHNNLEQLPMEIMGCQTELWVGYNHLCNLADTLTNWLDSNAVSEKMWYFNTRDWQYQWRSYPWESTQICDSISIEKKDTKKLTASLTLSPNPFNPSTCISYNLGPARTGTMKIFDIRGKMVFERSIKGSETIVWDARGLNSGMYCFKISAGNSTFIKKGILLK